MLSRALLRHLLSLGCAPCVTSRGHAAMATGVRTSLAPWTACGARSASRGAHRGWQAAPVVSAVPGATRGKSAVAAVATSRDARPTTITHVFRPPRRVPRAVTLVPRAVDADVDAKLDAEPLDPSLDPSTGEPWGWTLVGCDSDAGGALVVVRGPSPGVVNTVTVLDCPTMKVEVNGKQRTRLCVEAMVELVNSQKIPKNTVAHVEEGGVEYGFSAQTAFVQGYNFGLWKGVLAGANLNVRIVKPQAWKYALGLAHKGSTKDESRELATRVIPSVADSLKRKKDHGRAEALLIAVYGHVADQARGERVANDEKESLRVERVRAAEDGQTSSSSSEEMSSSPSTSPSITSSAEDPLCALVREVVVASVAERAALAEEEGGENDDSDSSLRNALGPDDPLPYFGPYFGMSGKQLSAELKVRKLKVSGKKMELVARLEMDDAERRRKDA